MTQLVFYKSFYIVRNDSSYQALFNVLRYKEIQDMNLELRSLQFSKGNSQVNGTFQYRYLFLYMEILDTRENMGMHKFICSEWFVYTYLQLL